ncbi:hypothetical protein B0T18DRAFT_394448 [Schizothecium vesticola]|uniref:Nucleotidyltransferase n=1 Tax=Schizothecium vesticola TaxID=314040 RepID=A0AA40EHF0_9PEZI|nr:hypothetical protein B0T18DRAFT_394448 [Schizothecium vesticola]
MDADATHTAHKTAAEAFTAVLTAAKVPHAFIGGFAVNMLGHHRYTGDVDIEVDAADIISLRASLVAADPRFVLVQNKLGAVPVETLPIGEIGLPRVLHIMELKDSPIPILRSSILVLTKIKRCVQFIDSTHPKSLTKLGQDLADIGFLLRWLHQNNQKVDFVDYSYASMDRLYEATKKLAGY